MKAFSKFKHLSFLGEQPSTTPIPTYSSVVSIFSDGRVANYVPQDSDSVTYWNEANEVWVEDAKYVLDQVEKLAKADPDHRFTDRMDMP
ncbi:hypothetical protein [Lysinibacillus sp. NPDC056232]|uniref:hypothetical protein n=1 Tax=Lysinibacillus sp. NPDC056232 TaxID=3345756 RepID=UPI0035D753D4